MEVAETKTKRIRHCYPRAEVYHRFIHSAEHAYTNGSNSPKVSCIGNYLFNYNIYKRLTIQTIEESWSIMKDRVLAVIDRNKKTIIIKKSISYYAYDLMRAIPDSYTIYYTNHDIPCFDILQKEETLLHVHSRYLVEHFVDVNLTQAYFVLDNKARKLNADIVSHINKNIVVNYKNIVRFAKKHKLHKYSFYKTWDKSDYVLSTYITDRTVRKTIQLPTLQKVVNNTFFTKKQKLFLTQKYFWSTWCCGNGIPFTDVVDNWDKPTSVQEIKNYIDKNKYLTFNEDWTVPYTTWNDVIIKIVDANNSIKSNIHQQNISKSIENRTKAEEKALNILKTKNINIIDNWRAGKHIDRIEVPYRDYCRVGKTATYRWVDKTFTLNRNCSFENTQLKLNNNNFIQTSRYATVSLDEGIKMFKLFNILRSKHPEISSFTSSNFGNIHVGIYDLRFITYKDKTTDSGKCLGYKEWLIQIGCHALWLDDIMDFIHYYKLEDKFGINK